MYSHQVLASQVWLVPYQWHWQLFVDIKRYYTEVVNDVMLYMVLYYLLYPLYVFLSPSYSPLPPFLSPSISPSSSLHLFPPLPLPSPFPHFLPPLSLLSPSPSSLLPQVGLLDVDICGPSAPKLMNIENSIVVNSPYGWTPLE